jgi:uncharacterized protein (TIGR02118 family)
MTVLRVCYKQGVRFDEVYYTSKHLPLAAGVMRPHGLKNVEMVRVTKTADGSKPPYQVIFSAYFESGAGLQNALESPQMGGVVNDIQNFYDGLPEIFIGEVVALPV